MKTNNIIFRVSDELKEEIKREADKLGLTTSAYLIMIHKQHKNK